MLNGRSRFVQTSPKWRQGQSTGTCLRGQPAHGCSSRRPCTKSILEAPDEHSDAPDHTPSKVGKLHPPPPERLKDRSQRPCPNRPRTDPPIEMTVRSADPQDYAALLTSSNRITIGRGQDDSHCVGQLYQYSGDPLQPKFEERTIMDFEQPMGDMEAVIGVDADEVGVEGDMVDLRRGPSRRQVSGRLYSVMNSPSRSNKKVKVPAFMASSTSSLVAWRFRM